MTTAGASAADLRRAAVLGWPVAALALGVLYGLAAYFVHPLALPAAVAVVASGAVSVVRPEVGAAVALLLASLNPGFLERLPWLPAAGWTAFLFVVVAVRLAVAGQRVAGLYPVGVLAGIFVAVELVAFSVATETSAAVPILRSSLTGVMLFLIIAATVRSRTQVNWVVGGAVGGAALIGGFATWQYLTGATTSTGFLTSSGELVGRVAAGFAHPNQLGGFLVVLVPFALAGAVLHRGARPACLAAAVLAGIGVYASFSRGALIGLLIVPLVMLRGRTALALVSVLALAVALWVPALARERFATVSEQGPQLASRLDIWHTAGAIWAAHPVLGVGLGGFPDAYAEARRADKRFLPKGIFEPPPHAHNIFLQLLAEQGLLGLVSFVAVLAGAVAQCLRLRVSRQRWLRVLGKAGLASLTVFVIHNQFDVTLLENTAIYFWALLGLLSALVVLDRAPAT